MSEEAQKLLMMLINDAYKSTGGSKKTAIAMMRYVEKDPELQKVINSGDTKKILNYTPK